MACRAKSGFQWKPDGIRSGQVLRSPFPISPQHPPLLHTWRIRSVRWRRWSSASSCWACRFSASSTASVATESLSCCRRRSSTRESSVEPTQHNIRPLPHEPCCRRIIFKGEQGDKFYVIYEGVVAINDVYSDITLNRGVRTISNCPIRCLPANHAHCCWCERCQKHFGDVALLENKPRNADVFAQTDGRSRP